MALTQRELTELEQLILTVWGESEHESVMPGLMLMTGDPAKIRKLLNERAGDIEDEDPENAKRLRYFAKNYGGSSF